MKLIDKSAIVAEIDRRIEVHHNLGHWNAEQEFLKVKKFIDTLEVKEVDLEKELDYDDYMSFFKEHPEYNNGDWGFEETWTFAQYCYKLGLKAHQKE